MKYNVKFYLDGKKSETYRPIFADVSFAGNRIKCFTGYRVKEIHFNQFSEKNSAIVYGVAHGANGLKGELSVKYNEINSKLDSIKEAIKQLLDSTSVSPSKETIKAAINNTTNKAPKATKNSTDLFWDTFELYTNEAEVSDLRREQLKSCIKQLKRFEISTKSKFTFTSIDGTTISNFEQWLLTDKNSLRKKDKPEGKIARSQNHVSGILKRLRAFYNSDTIKTEIKNGTTVNNPFADFSITAEIYGDPIFLTKKERESLYAFNPENERLQKVKDIFIFQSLVGCRVGDLCKLKVENISENKLQYIPSKTAKGTPKTITIPLNKEAIEILARYNESDGRLLPFITDQRYNDYLRELCKAAGLIRPVIKLNPKTGVSEIKALCDVISSHTARKTFIGVLYSAKVKDDIICSMSGHIEGSKSFLRYRAVDEALKSDAIAEL